MAMDAQLKNRAVAAIAGMVLLYFLGGALWFVQLNDKASAWNASQKQFKQAREKYLRERKLISEKSRWNDLYDEEREKMPMFPEGEDVNTHWLRQMDALAEKHHVFITTRSPGLEQEVGDVYELPIDVKNWEGGLEPLVRFLYGLEHAEEAMFDVRSIAMRPSSHKGAVKGQFTLTCAYMRGDVEDKEVPVETKASRGKNLKEKK